LTVRLYGVDKGSGNVVAETELAWSAGFFDGEGSTVVWRSTHSTQTMLSITQIDRRVLDRFAEAVGEGGVNGPYERKAAGQQPLYQYKAAGARAHRAMELLWPYLGQVKREQYERVVADVREARRGAPEHELGTDVCRAGHEGNWTIRKRGGRECRTCANDRQRERRHAA
jgi:hypothetical protein